MAGTNDKHNDAVKLVKSQLEDMGFQIDDAKEAGVDICAKRKGRTYYFIVIMGTKQKGKSIYAGININSWLFVFRSQVPVYFIAAIKETSGSYSYYDYTPKEMWECSNKPYLHIKCNPLKNTMHELKKICEDGIEDRYTDRKDLDKVQQNMSNLFDNLQSIVQ